MRRFVNTVYWLLAASSLVTAVWFACVTDGVVSFMLYFWPATVLVFLNMTLAAFFTRREATRVLLGVKGFPFLPLLFSACIVIYGILFENMTGLIRPHAGHVLTVLLGAQLAVIIWQVAIMRGARWLVASTGIFSLWLSFHVGIIVAMMVTGDWL